MDKVLIIEDELTTAELEKNYLELTGFEVTVESNGNSGLQQALSGNYQLIILDLMLPGLDGVEICKRIRETSEIPIIMISSKTEVVDKIRGFGVGANDYLTKPFDPGELVARVRSHLERYQKLTGRSAQTKNEVIVTGGLKIDRTARRVFVDDVEKFLTTKEFDLLYFLASYPNHVFSKEELLQEVWDLNPIGADIATVTVHVKKIREKIEKDTQNPKYIETVWAVGYRCIDSDM